MKIYLGTVKQKQATVKRENTLVETTEKLP
jgi:hypothetical protein